MFGLKRGNGWVAKKMKINLLYVFAGTITILSGLFGVYAVKCGPYRELDAYMTEPLERDKEYYDEEMAVRLAAVVVLGYGNLQGTLEESVEVVYNYPTNEWLVILSLDDPLWDRVVVGVRRDNGSIEFYGWMKW